MCGGKGNTGNERLYMESEAFFGFQKERSEIRVWRSGDRASGNRGERNREGAF